MKLKTLFYGLFYCPIIIINSFAVAPPVPTLSAPSNNSTNILTPSTLSWNSSSGATSYTIEFSTDPGFSSTKATASAITSSTSKILYGLFNGITYYWHVKASNGSEESAFSSPFVFTTKKATVTNGNAAGQTDVGIWYCPYGYYDPAWGWGPSPGWTCKGPFEPLCSNTPNDFRQYRCEDATVIDYHLQQIAGAKIDFITQDCTNGGFGVGIQDNATTIAWVNTAKVVCTEIKKWNDNNRWKLRYVLSIGAWWDGPSKQGDYIEAQAKVCIDNFYNNAAYGGNSNWYSLDGKPLLIVICGVNTGTPLDNFIAAWYSYCTSSGFSSKYSNKFTVRFAAMGEKGTYGWGAWGGVSASGSVPPSSLGFGRQDFGLDKSTNGIGTVIDDEVELVGPGYDNCSTSDGSVACQIYRNNGQFYTKYCWDRVLANKKPRIVMIASFNDYWEKTAVWTARATSDCGAATCSFKGCEQWTGTDGIEHPYMYWNLTKGYIKRLRGEIVNSILYNN